MILEHATSQLILIDYQPRLLPALVDGAACLTQARRLAQMATWLNIPVWGTEQVPEKLGHLEPELAVFCKKIVSKTEFSAFGVLHDACLRPKPAGNARSLPKHLQKPTSPMRPQLVLAGVEAHVCLLQTALALIEAEFEVWVVQDACTSRVERHRDAAFDRLASAGAELVTTEMVGFEWLESADHPYFTNWLGLIK